MEAAPHPWPTLGVLLMRDGLVTKEELEAILAEQRDSRQQRITGRRLGEILIARGRVTPTQVAKLIAEQYELPYVDLDPAGVDVRIARRLDEASARRFSAVPINVRPDGSLLLAIGDPSTVLFSDELRRVLGSVPNFAVVGPEVVHTALDLIYNPANDPPPAPVGVVDDLIVADANGEPPQNSYFGSARAAAHLWPPLGALLVREGLVSDAELETALAQQRLSTSHRLGEILVERGVVSRSAIARLVAEQYELPFVELGEIDVDPAVARLLPEEMARAYPAVPVARNEDGALAVAIADPTNVFYSDDLHLALGVPLTFVVASPDAIERLVTAAHASAHPEPQPEAEQEHPEAVGATPTWSEALTMPDLPSDPEPAAALETFEQEQDDLVPTLLAQAAAAEPAEAAAPEAEEQPVELEPAEPMVISLAEPVPTAEAVEVDEPAAEAHAPEALEALEDLETAADASTAAPVYSLYEPDDLQEEPAEEQELEPAEPMVISLAESVPAGEAVEVDEPAAVVQEEPAEEPEAEQTTPPILALAPDPAGAHVFEPVADEPELDEAEPEHEVRPEDEQATPDEELEEPAAELYAEVALEEHDRTPLVVADALASGATALHLSPREDGLLVRARVDGVVRELGTVPAAERDALLDQLAQAGLTVQLLTTKRGEKITARTPHVERGPETLDQLGLPPDATENLRAAFDRPLGVTIVCGPFGSGVTTTLYAALRELDTHERVLATLERPVARLVDGVDQVEVDPAAGVTFASGLESLVAGDSDVVLVGELPDTETATAAFRAALSGRRILTSLRMPNAVTAFRRLADLGLEPTVVAAALTCIVSQQLVRRVCSECRETYYASESELTALGEAASANGPRLLVRGRGCPACGGTGFRGRTGVFEVVPADGVLIDLAASGASISELERAAAELGVRTLRDEAIRLCLDGVTTADEVQRVFGSA